MTINEIPSDNAQLHLEIVLHFLISETANVVSLDDLLDALSKFAVFFNFLRPFRYCNETTLANIMNLVMMLVQAPQQTNGFNAFTFPSVQSLRVYSFAEMRALLKASLTIIPRESALLNIQKISIHEELPTE